MKTLDFRSDTVTQPTPAMREAIAKAPVGDDVYGEDPSVNELQRVSAELVGKEAALFVPSGTMANQIAVRAWTEPGDALIAATGAHLYRFEAGAVAGLSGVQSVLVGSDGLFTAEDVRAALAPDDAHFAATRLVCVENTHNASGGRIFPLAEQERIAELAREAGARLHLDGARLWNAAIATGSPASALAAPFDSVSFCLSKGLGAPVGSLLCGSPAFVARAHRIRKMFGGGMRQAGLLAAAGLYALEHHIERLADDHANATRLAEGLASLPGVELVRASETNIVLFRAPGRRGLLRELAEAGVRMGAIDDSTFRAVTHLDVDSDSVDRALALAAGIMR